MVASSWLAQVINYPTLSPTDQDLRIRSSAALGLLSLGAAALAEYERFAYEGRVAYEHLRLCR
jgi:hypothetical protein